MKSSKWTDAATLTDGDLGKDRGSDLERQLHERVKELHCLAELSRLIDLESSIEGLLAAAVKLLTPAWQFPDDAVARIRFHDQVFETAALEECDWVLQGELKRGTALSSVEVGYRVEHPFLPEEGQLLEMVCERLERVVQRFESEQALRLSERRYRLLADNTMDVIWAVNADLEFTYVNAAVTALTGFTPEEFVGSRAQDHCDDATMKEVEFAIGKALAEGTQHKGTIIEFDILHRDGHSIPVEIHARVLFDENGEPIGFQGTSRDIRERRQTLAALRESEEQYRTMFVTMAQGALLQNSLGEIISANPAAERILGYSLEEMKGRLCEDPRWGIVREDGSTFPAQEHPSRLALHTGQPVRDIIMGVLNPREKAHRWVQVSAVPHFRPNQPTPYQVYSTFEDITDRKKIEQDRGTLESQLRQAQKLEAVGRLAGGVAHDFNNMLGVILGNVELALQSVPPTHPAFQDLNEIANAARRSASLTQQLLAFARKQTVAPQVLNLNETVQGTLQMLERLIGENIELTWKPEAGLPAVTMDRGQLDQVLTNLVVNARDAIEGAGSIVVATRSTVLSPEYCQQHHGFKPGTYVILSVQDTGCGMEDKILENLFEPFFTTKLEGNGPGLGLSTVHGILQQNQGLVKVSSKMGVGTTFQVYLPAAKVSGESGDHEPAGQEQPEPETVLVVDDEPSLLKLTERMLKGMGYRVKTAKSPQEALQLCQDGIKFDLLLTDVVLPGMNGRQLYEALDQLYPGLRCLFMSGYTSDALANRDGVLEEHVHFLQKPYSRQQLADKIQAALE